MTDAQCRAAALVLGALAALLGAAVLAGWTLDVVTDRIPAATIIPTKALFTRQGKPTVYVSSPDGFRTVAVQILARNSDEVAIKGVDAAARVALVDPFADGVNDTPSKAGAAAAAGAAPAARGSE